ncbi:MAG: pseudouridine-5'-phosphate glycosidase [Candidatus Sericytochromatia bacterium]|nr:pseudouridine-5'-phosphate glycosidase [Candidatus Sericytochromatia bacterium]
MTPKPALSLTCSEEVAAARREGRPLVALETTILTHGMPWPANVETALEVEAIIRAGGAVPATMAILEGVPRAGLTRPELEALGRATGVAKASRRDLAVLAARRATGATTVAGTMVLAGMANIAVFVTGGLGGVHRGATRSLDISADLTELSRTPVGVVCAGVKSILDIGLTLEVLETQGVPVLGYGTDRFPAFYVADSGHAVPARVDSPEEAARVLAIQRAWGLGGLVLANPIPAAEALAGEAIEAVIAETLADAEAQGVRGKAITPFVLAELNRRTDGQSLRANIALIRHNASLGAAVAVALAALR